MNSKPKSLQYVCLLHRPECSGSRVNTLEGFEGLDRAEVPPPGKNSTKNKHSTEFTSSAGDNSFFLFRRHEHVLNSPSAQLTVQLGRESIEAVVLSVMLNSFHIMSLLNSQFCISSHR